MLAAVHNIMRAREDGGKERQRQNRRMRRSTQREREAEGDRRVQVRDVMVHSSRDRRYPGQWCTYIYICIYICMYILTCTRTHIYVFVSIHTQLCMRVYTYVCTKGFVYVSREMHTCTWCSVRSSHFGLLVPRFGQLHRIPGFPLLRRVSDKSVAGTLSARIDPGQVATLRHANFSYLRPSYDRMTQFLQNQL